MNQLNDEIAESISPPLEEEVFDALAGGAVRWRAREWRKNNGEVGTQEWQFYKTHGHDQIISLLHEVAKEVMLPGDIPFVVVRGKTGTVVRCNTPLGQRLLKIACADFFQVYLDYPLHHFSPVFRVFAQLRRAVPSSPSSLFDRLVPAEDADSTVLQALRFVTALRRALGRKSIKTAHHNFRRGAKDNFNRFIDALDWLFQRRKEVTVLRFDLHYREAGSQPVKYGDKASFEGVDQFMGYRERFHRSLDRRFCEALLGYAWALEYGREAKWHLHYLVMLAPSDRHDDHSGLVHSLGEKWESLTERRGYIRNVNVSAKHRYSAVGRVRLDNPDVVMGLHFLVSYMTLAGLFVKLDAPERFIAFHTGRFPKKALPQVGRPANRSSGSRLRITIEQAQALVKFI